MNALDPKWQEHLDYTAIGLDRFEGFDRGDAGRGQAVAPRAWDEADEQWLCDMEAIMFGGAA